MPSVKHDIYSQDGRAEEYCNGFVSAKSQPELVFDEDSGEPITCAVPCATCNAIIVIAAEYDVEKYNEIVNWTSKPIVRLITRPSEIDDPVCSMDDDYLEYV